MTLATRPPDSNDEGQPLNSGARPVAANDALSFDLSLPSERASQPAPPESPEPAPKKGIFGILVVIGLFLMKFKSIFVFLKFGKIFTTSASMLLSIGVYSAIWGWKFATGFVLLTFVHEMGHVLVAWRKKLPVSAPMFIPFLGAFINLKAHPQDALTEAQIGYGGPLLGAIGDTIAWGLYYLTGNPVFLAVASFSMMVNLFNLMPVSPLDGGRITAAISPRLWLVGLIGMGAWFFYTHSPIILLVVIVGAFRLSSQWKTMSTDSYYDVTPKTRAVMTILYIGLALYLAMGHSYTHHLVENWIDQRNLSGGVRL